MTVASHHENCGICHAEICEHTLAAYESSAPSLTRTDNDCFEAGYRAAKAEVEATIRAAKREAWLQGLQFALAGMPTARELEKMNPYPTEKSE